MKQFIKENWGLLFIGILNLVFAFIAPFKWLIILNSCIGSSIVTSFVIFCILHYHCYKNNNNDNSFRSHMHPHF
jgi:hypothetical protein